MEQIKPGYKQTDVGVIPEDWGADKIKNVCSITTGDKNTQDRKDTGLYPFFVRSSTVERIDSYSFDGEAVLTAGDGDTGKIFHYINGKFDFHQRVYKMSHFTHRMNGFFFYKYFSNHFYNRAMSMTAKSSVDSVRMEMIADMLILLPKPEEQTAIAEALSDMDELIESLGELVAKKRAIKTATMQQLLTGKKRLPGFDGGWAENRVDNFGYFKSGNGFPTKHQGHEHGDFPFFKVSDMNNLGNATHMNVANNYISKNVAKTLGTYIILERSIVFAKIGAAIFLERKKITVTQSCIDNNMMAFILDHSISDYKFFHYLFLYLNFGKLVTATALPSLSAKDIGGLLLNIPAKKEQTAIAIILSDMDTEIQILEERLAKTRSLKAGMMQELLTGKTRLLSKDELTKLAA